MKLSKELLLQAVNAAFEFNAENDHAVASVSYSEDHLALSVNIFLSNDFAYYKVSNSLRIDEYLYAESHEQNLADFLDALKSHSSTL